MLALNWSICHEPRESKCFSDRGKRGTHRGNTDLPYQTKGGTSARFRGGSWGFYEHWGSNGFSVVSVRVAEVSVRFEVATVVVCGCWIACGQWDIYQIVRKCLLICLWTMKCRMSVCELWMAYWVVCGKGHDYWGFTDINMTTGVAIALITSGTRGNSMVNFSLPPQQYFVPRFLQRDVG